MNKLKDSYFFLETALILKNFDKKLHSETLVSKIIISLQMKIKILWLAV